MKLINHRFHAVAFLRRKLYSLFQSFPKDCQVSYEEAAAAICRITDLQSHIDWLENFNENAPQVKLNHASNNIEFHFADGRVMHIQVEEYSKLATYLQAESLDLPRKKAFYLVEMLHCAQGLHNFGVFEPDADRIVNICDTIEKFYYLVYHLLPLYRDHMHMELL